MARAHDGLARIADWAGACDLDMRHDSSTGMGAVFGMRLNFGVNGQYSSQFLRGLGLPNRSPLVRAERSGCRAETKHRGVTAAELPRAQSQPRARNRSAIPASSAAPRGITASSSIIRVEWMPQHWVQSAPSGLNPRKNIAPGTFSST